MYIKLFISIIFIIGCSSLDPGAEKVVLTKHIPEGCTHLGSVSGFSIFGGIGDANIDLKNEALKLGGNVVEVIAYGTREASGTAYKCPDRAVNSINSSNLINTNP